MTYTTLDIHAAPTISEVREIKNNPECSDHVVLRLRTNDGAVVYFFPTGEIPAVIAVLAKAQAGLEAINELPMERAE